MANEISFGIGCFHFSPREISSENFSGDDFIGKLRESLESINNIKEIMIDGFKWFSGGDFVGKHPIYDCKNIQDGPGLFPHAINSRVQFEIFIPTRIQKELLDDSYRDTKNENFQITINYLDHFPVAVVRGLDQTIMQPSNSVVLIRRFLEKELGEQKNLPVEFQSLGPSPFHADFFLRMEILNNPEKIEEISCEKIHLPGYDDIIIHTKEKEGSLDNLKDKAIERLLSELSYFYFLVQSNNLNQHIWVEVEESVENLKQSLSDKRLLSRAINVIKTRNHLDSAFLNIADLEMGMLDIKQKYLRWKKEIATLHDQIFLEDYLESEVMSGMEFPTNHMLQIVQLCESRRTISAQNTAVLLSAILGGILGAGISVLFQA